MYITYAMKETNFCVLLFLAFLTPLCSSIAFQLLNNDFKLKNKIKQNYRIKRNTWNYDYNYNEISDDYTPLAQPGVYKFDDHKSQALRSRHYTKLNTHLIIFFPESSKEY